MTHEHRSAQTPGEEERPTRGRLKIFLGYAAGVGKTYAMLEAANQRAEEGVDVVAGYVETHGRAETEALLNRLEVIPRRLIGSQAEMDLDAVLARRPQLVLVDELSHTNATGTRHSKRYQDVEELLSTGIDVYTTLSIQHLESLKDIVTQITGVVVHETVPDRIMDVVDSIELIDLPPEELIQRLHEGKVYIPDQAARAIEKFFRPGNLTALREMALRHTAAQVDDQMRAYRRAHAIFYTWAATDRLLVCVGSNPLSERLVRAGRRLADQLDVEWFVLYVDSSRAPRPSEATRDRIARALRLAEELGAKTDTISGENVADAILGYARSRNVTKIIVGKSLDSGWKGWLRGSIVDQIIHHSRDIDVYVISAPAERIHRARLLPQTPHPWRFYLYSLALVVLVSLGCIPFRELADPSSLVMIYLLAVVIAGTSWGRGPSILAAILGVLAFDFFIVPPHLTLAVSDVQYLLTFVGLFVVGLVISTLTVREREQAETSRRRETHTATLYSLSRDLATTVELGIIAQAAIKHVSELFGCETAVFLPRDSTFSLYARSSRFPIDEAGYAVATWVFQHGQKAGQGTETLATAGARYLPLRTAQGVIGVLGIKLLDTDLTPDQERLLEALMSQVALAIEATQLAEEAHHARLLRETEKLQSALLNSISHDLRTPLASITGALSSLRDDAEFLNDIAQRELLDTAWDEADRLNHLVENLLNMTRLEAGAMRLILGVCDLQDIVGVALNQMSNPLRNRSITVDVPGTLPLVSADITLMAQALVNLIDNAIKYSPPDSVIEIHAYPSEADVVVEISDRGIGIPPDEIAHIFDKFYRVQRVSDTRGTGLGLSISRGIVELHRGRIWAQARAGGGTTVAIALPAAESEPD